MKKILPILLLLVLLTGCFEKGPEVSVPSDSPPPSYVSIPQIIDLICQNVEVPAYEASELTEKNFENFAFIPYMEGLTGYQADALINAIPHSLVLIYSENGDTANLAQNILANANTNKWICVSADTIQTAYTEHYVILIMSSFETVEGLIANFETAVDDGDATILDFNSLASLNISRVLIAD
ncbi:MAG: hypothetical protein WC332_10230 [Clostridia bacterium]|jgi:predicted small lipoprotein YifL